MTSSNAVPVQTSVPDWMLTYNRQLAEVHYQRKLNRMYLTMISAYLQYEPWKAKPPFAWRQAKIPTTKQGLQRKGSNLGWVPMNMQLPEDLHRRVQKVIESVNTEKPDGERRLSLRVFLYTVVCWWCQVVYPYERPGLVD